MVPGEGPSYSAHHFHLAKDSSLEVPVLCSAFISTSDKGPGSPPEAGFSPWGNSQSPFWGNNLTRFGHTLQSPSLS